MELEHSIANFYVPPVTVLNGLVSHDLVRFLQKPAAVPIGNFTGDGDLVVESF